LDNSRAENERLRRRIAVLEASPRAWAPSQGQEIPDDQLDTILEGAHRAGLDAADWGRQAAHDAYRIGYAAALGYRIEIEDGRVGVGDRVEPATVPGLDWHGLRTTIEHAIRARLGSAWPHLAEDYAVGLEQLAAEAAKAALGVPLLAQIVAWTEPPVTPAGDVADEAAYERVARAIRPLLRPGYVSETPAVQDAALDREAYALAKAAVDAYRAGPAPEPTSRGIAWAALQRLADGLRDRRIAIEGVGPRAYVYAALDHIDRLTTALNDAARDVHETAELEAVYDGGLPTDEIRRIEALHIGADAINGAQWSEDFADAVGALLHNAPRIEAYIRDGADENAGEPLGRAELRAHYADGYQEAIRRLRDRDRYETWYAHRAYRQGLPQRSIFSPTATNGLAEYLEGTAPDPDDPWADAMPATGRPVLDGDTDGSPA
ncbi:MAG TPA: hypothetical protein VGK41_00590, partial [Solirubrobacterales bacterium]